MSWGGGDGTAQNFGPICIILPRMNQIGGKVKQWWGLKIFNENFNIYGRRRRVGLQYLPVNNTAPLTLFRRAKMVSHVGV